MEYPRSTFPKVTWNLSKFVFETCENVYFFHLHDLIVWRYNHPKIVKDLQRGLFQQGHCLSKWIMFWVNASAGVAMSQVWTKFYDDIAATSGSQVPVNLITNKAYIEVRKRQRQQNSPQALCHHIFQTEPMGQDASNVASRWIVSKDKVPYGRWASYRCTHLNL